MFRLFLIISIAMFPLYSFALTIDETVSLALGSNNQIKAKKESVTARQYEKGAAFLIYFPSIGASYEYDLITDDFSSAGNGTSNYDASTLNVYANLNIFNGLSDMSNYQLSLLNYSMADLQLRTTNYDIVLDAQNAYINVLKAKHDVSVANENLDLLKLQKRDAQLSADNGLIAKNDLLQVDVYLASAQLQYITASSNLTIAIQNLEKVINRPVSIDETLIEPELISYDVTDIKKLQDVMYSNRSDLKYLEESYQASKKNERVARSSAFPKIDLKFSYNMYGNEPNPVAGNPQGKDSYMVFGAVASWNLITAASSVVQGMAKTYDTQSVAYNIADTKQSMNLQLRTAVESYIMSQAQLAQAKISVNHAKENYRVKKNLFEQNAATTTDLLDASVLLNQANVAESQALYSVISSVYQIERYVEMPLKEILK